MVLFRLPLEGASVSNVPTTNVLAVVSSVSVMPGVMKAWFSYTACTCSLEGKTRQQMVMNRSKQRCRLTRTLLRPHRSTNPIQNNIIVLKQRHRRRRLNKRHREVIILRRPLERRCVRLKSNHARARRAGDLVVDTLLGALVDVEVIP